MKRLKYFLIFLCLIVITLVTVFISALIYRANNQTSIKTYMFQMDNSARQRVGPLQDLTKITPEELLHKLIHKYVSEYFRVTPSDKNVLARSVINKLSTPEALIPLPTALSFT